MRQPFLSVGLMTRFKYVLRIILLAIFLSPSTVFSKEPIAVTKCKEACKNNEPLKSLVRSVAYDPISICINCCEEKNGDCPAQDGSGGPYMGCIFCGASGGIYCEGGVR